MKPPSEEKFPFIRIPAAFPGTGWGKLRGENYLKIKPFGSPLVRCFPAVFWQTGRDSGAFSTGTEKGGFTGFSGRGRDSNRGKGTRTGLIYPQGTYPLVPGVSDGGYVKRGDPFTPLFPGTTPRTPPPGSRPNKTQDQKTMAPPHHQPARNTGIEPGHQREK